MDVNSQFRENDDIQQMLTWIDAGKVLVHTYNEWKRDELLPLDPLSIGFHLINLHRYFLPVTYTAGLMITRAAYESVGGFRDVDQMEATDLGLRVAMKYPFGVMLVPMVTVEVSARRVKHGIDLDYNHAYRGNKLISV